MKVFDYDVDGSRHAREGVATYRGNGLFDTFWGESGGNHRLNDAERMSAVLRFDTDDFDEVVSYSRSAPSEWSGRRHSDRATIPSQQGLQIRWFIRKGSAPDYETRLANAVGALEEAERELRSAEFRVRWASEDVRKIRGGEE